MGTPSSIAGVPAPPPAGAGAPQPSQRDFLQIADLSRMRLEGLLAVAAGMKSRPEGLHETHRGESVAYCFNKPSTRTRVSFEAAAGRLGMLPIALGPDELQLGRAEPIADTARVLSAYAAAIVIRAYSQQVVEEVAAAASVPVINALTDEHHPCQALADMLTLHERFGRLDGLQVAYVGAGNNVAHSLLQAGAMLGIGVRIATPPDYRPDDGIVSAAAEVAGREGGSVLVTTDPLEAVDGAHAVYTDTWVSVGEDAERLRSLRPYRVDDELMDQAREEAIFMHCLPAHRGEEVSASVIDGPHSAAFQQAANRLPTEQAVLSTLVGGRQT